MGNLTATTPDLKCPMTNGSMILPAVNAANQRWLRARRLCAVAVAAASANLGLAIAHGSAWPCPFHALTGLPCPGCGLTRSTMACLHGRLDEALSWHLLGPLVPVVFLAAVTVVVLPARRGEALIDRLWRTERRLHAGWVLLAVLVGYWVLRLTGLFGLPSV